MTTSDTLQPDPPAAGPPPPPGGAAAPASGGSFDLGYLFAFMFRDPRVVQKLLVGCLAVLLIPLFGLGLVALAGYSLATARGMLRGDEHPMPDWNDLGGLLLDGLKVAVVVAAFFAAAAFVGGAVFLFTAFWTFIGQSLGSPAAMVMAVFGVAVSVFFAIFLALLLFGLQPIAVLRLAASGRIGDAFRFGEHLSLIRAHLGTFLFLLLTLILFHILSEATVLLCLIGIIPGAFWGFAASGAAIGHAGRVMGVRAESGAAGAG